MKEHGYPEAREARDVEARPASRGEAVVVESTAPLTCANTDAQLIRFSGVPDVIDLTAHTFPVIFTFQNAMEVELGEVTVGPGIPYSARVAAVRVLARNAIAGSNGVASAIGRWFRGRVLHAEGQSPAQWTAP